MSCQINVFRLYINAGDEKIIHTVREAKRRPADAASQIQNPVPCFGRTRRRDHHGIQGRAKSPLRLEQADFFIEDEYLFGHAPY